MTRGEQRAQCIEAMCKARYESGTIFAHWEEESELFKEDYRRKETYAFDSLHGIAFVDPIEATEEMIEAGRSANLRTNPTEGLYQRVFRAMAALGKLTNPPEEKP